MEVAPPEEHYVRAVYLISEARIAFVFEHDYNAIGAR
jgi:hypothetical protein